ncbi:hypothetical protein C7821_111151 [Streptomyces sp. VMFN-G11Ma]|jgi:hypothetical protein|nr:hypothetical protein C7821_111151 [Streptomyces sp. VMFN-G11Ma]
MGADWRQLLPSDGFLDACRLFYVHFDERGSSATLGFETRECPVDPLPEWVENGYNAFEFYFVFTGVTGVRVRRQGTSLGSGDSGISFRASAVELVKSRAYLASGSF